MTNELRQKIRDAHFQDESSVLEAMIGSNDLSFDSRQKISQRAVELINTVRDSCTPGVMESFLGEYGLSTDEGVALMCLAEALLRVPDEETIDQLIRDKIAPHDWGSHVGDSGSILINASTWALMLTGRVLDEEDPGVVGALQGLVRRLGEPVVRVAVKRAMQELGAQFVLGENISDAIERGAEMEARGYTYSYDMLGEAARTHDDAEGYFNAYADAIKTLAQHTASDDIRNNPGISVKLSALHPRYEFTQASTTLPELSERLIELCALALKSNVGLNIDAEEANRLDISLDIIERVLDAESLQHWQGLGIVVQAYGRRAKPVLDWIYAEAVKRQRKLMVRLVKGAYWDSEIKQSQVLGHPSFPVFTTKAATDVSYLYCANQLLGMTDRIYAQFATHNAHTISAILHLQEQMPSVDRDNFEFQRLHGMGESVHELVMEKSASRCRIYAPVGAHEDLLAYLVRRLLENGANSSFVSQIVDLSVSAEEIAEDPFEKLDGSDANPASPLPVSRDLYLPSRINSRGWDISNVTDIDCIEQQRQAFLSPYQWHFGNGDNDTAQLVSNPGDGADQVGSVYELKRDAVTTIIDDAINAQIEWEKTAVADRAATLIEIAEIYERNAPELFALLAREAGKTLADAIGEVREAVDFLRYYAARAVTVEKDSTARGVVICISPWNFPLAIFTGQIAAALVTGNAVVAKPAEQSPLIACHAIALMLKGGIPEKVLQIAVGAGETIGAALTADSRIGGVCFTGSTEVARLIERQLADTATAQAMLIAETGGLNAMIVDSTALPEQAVRDVMTGAFQSAGQRCSALRMLYLQSDRAEDVLSMLKGAMETLVIGDPLRLATDVGPVIDAEAYRHVDEYVQARKKNGQIEKELQTPDTGNFISPTLIKVSGIDALEEEIFGPVLHYAIFEADEIHDIVEAINRRGYGLTLGLHSRIDARVQDVIDSADVGNVYINRNQIGAVVGSQPFGGEGLSGTGPKAGGPHYLARFRKANPVSAQPEANKASSNTEASNGLISAAMINKAFAGLNGHAWEVAENKIGILRSVLRGRASQTMGRAAALECGPVDLPGPTGESNRLTLYPLGRVLCVNDDPEALMSHVIQALRTGNAVVCIGPDCAETLAPLTAPGIPVKVLEGHLEPSALLDIDNINGLAVTGSEATVKNFRQVLARRDGAIVRLISETMAPTRFAVERAVCIDTTAAGGNAQLLAATP